MHSVLFRCVKVSDLLWLSMPVFTPAVAWSRAVTLPVPLEPDIEHLRRRHSNTTSLCLALIGQLQLPSSSSSYLLSLSQLNCSLPSADDNTEEVTWWLQQLALDHDPVYYVLPVVLIAGIVCDTLSAWLLARLLLRTPARCQVDVTSDVYLLWLTVACDLWLACASVRALPDYVTGHVIESLHWVDGYAAAVGEWLSFTCLWLLLTMSLNATVRLSASRTEHHQLNSENSSKHPHQQQQQDRNGCRQLFVCIAIYMICLVSSLPQFFAYQLVDSSNAETNRTVIVSQLDDQLTTSYEYSVVYHWYVVCLTVLLPVPLLIVIAAFLAASLLQKSRARHKKVPVKPSGSVQGPRAWFLGVHKVQGPSDLSF